MKTYTIEDFKMYLHQQDSLGDAIYNLKDFSEYLRKAETVAIETPGRMNDYLVELESHQGERFVYEGVEYVVSEDVTSFIREYGEDVWMQINTLEQMLEQNLIEEA